MVPVTSVWVCLTRVFMRFGRAVSRSVGVVGAGWLWLAFPVVVVALVLLVSSSGRPAAGAGGCVSDLGKLSSASPSLSGTGTIAADAQCTSSLRDPDDSTSVYYARRHTFTLDAAATVSMSLGRASPGSVVTYLVVTDGSGAVKGRAAGHYKYGGSGLSYLLLPAGTYTIEATTVTAGDTGSYSVSVSWAAADECVEDLGKLSLAGPSLSGSGIVAVDAGCTSTLRDPQSSETFYARRHTFTLDAAATVTLVAGPSGSDAFMVLSDGSGVEVARAQGSSGRRSRSSAVLRYLLLSAGTYTVEASRPVGRVGPYSVSVQWAPADQCVEDLGKLGLARPSLSGSGIVAVDAGCVSSLRDPKSTDTFYARRHTFTLDAAATVSVEVGPKSSHSLLILADSAGTEVGRAQGSSSGSHWHHRPAQRAFRLEAGTYTVETSRPASALSPYTATVDWYPADDCVRDLGKLSSQTVSLSATGVIAQDAGCVSSLRDPDDKTSVYYARRHTFTLEDPATVSVQLTGAAPGWLSPRLVLADGSGTVLTRDSGTHLLLAKGTYTVEATTAAARDTGGYSVSVSWAAADSCVRDLGKPSSQKALLSGTGTIAVDSGCVSSLRDPDSTETFYARRHTFTLDAAATVSLGLGPATPRSLRTYMVLIDGSGTVIGRAAGHHQYGGSGLSYLLLPKGAYTLEATTFTAGDTGGYTVSVSWAAADDCVEDLGKLDAASSPLSGSGIVAVDAGCTSPLRDPDSTQTFYARRHTFTLDAAATVTLSLGPAGANAFMILTDSSGTEIGRAQGSSSRRNRRSATMSHWLLQAGTYTIETSRPPDSLGSYTVWASWAAADDCVEDLGKLTAASSPLSGGGIVAVDAGCVSSLRDLDSAQTFYARRHTFTLDAAATVSVEVGPNSPGSLLILSDSAGVELGRAQGSSGSRRTPSRPARREFRLAAGTYTVETSRPHGSVGAYTAKVSWHPADGCARHLGTLSSQTATLKGTGVIAQDAACVSSLRDPDSTAVYYARRHTFTLDAAATVSVRLGGASPGWLSPYLVLTDSAGTVLTRTSGSYLLLQAGAYTIEATTPAAGDTGGYTVQAQWHPADACVRDFGTLNAAKANAAGSGIVAVDAGCTSSLRDPDSETVYYARRHTFTLDTAATVSLSAAPSGSSAFVILADSDSAEIGRAQGWTGRRSSGSAVLRYLLLQAGTYTVETSRPVGSVGPYTAHVQWHPADACLRDLGTLNAATPNAAGSGIVAVDAGCTSSLRDPDSETVYYARRHTFTLDAAATVSLTSGPHGSSTAMILTDGTGAEIGRAHGWTGRRSSGPATLSHLLLQAGTYTLETSRPAGAVSPYTASVSWAAADPCERDLGTLNAARHTATGSGIVAVDPDCTSKLRDPDSTATYYARRHIFTLDAAATVSVELTPNSAASYLVLSDSTGNELGRAQGWSGRRSGGPARLANLPLEAGTYTVESSRTSGDVGYYSVRADRQPLWRHAVLTAASASESDGTAVFTLAAAVPQLDGPVSDVSPVWMRWETVSGTAAPGQDFTGTSGTVQIPADGSRATITLPITDDTASETTESFMVRLSNPSGATLANTQATAWIHDDDLAAGAAAQSSAVSTCEDPQITGTVGDVFDITQPAYSASTDVFVDVELSCKSGTPAAGGYRTGAEIMTGPAGRRVSSWCVRTDLSPLTRALRANDSCAASGPATLASPAVATHVIRIPDSAVGKGHQIRVWVDLDGDGTREAGEQSRFFPTSFIKEPGADGTLRFGLAEDFTTTVLDGSDTVGRAGATVELRVAVEAPTGRYAYDPAQSKPVPVTAPLADATLGAHVYTGPSGTAQVTCLPPAAEGLVSPGYSTHCATDADGIVTLQYRVEPTAVDSGPQQDDLRVYWDRNNDGKHQAAPNDPAREPSDTIPIPIAKAVNYVALGDSYSAGENGRRDFYGGFPGQYQKDVSPADYKCRRWNLAYPEILQSRLLNSGDKDVKVEFATFACVGAITLNVYDALDAEGTNTDPRSFLTKRAAPNSVLEPRQAKSLEKVDMDSVDLVTITIGGNDIGFSEILKDCVAPKQFPGIPTGNQDNTCDEQDVQDCKIAINQYHLTECVEDLELNYDEVFDEVEDRVAAVLTELRAIAPRASVMLLGYPYLAPVVEPCGGLTRDRVELLNSNYEIFATYAGASPTSEVRRARENYESELATLAISSECRDRLETYLASFLYCTALNAKGVFIARGLAEGAFAALGGGGIAKIDPGEALFLRKGADDVNRALSNAAQRAAVHFVDVVGGVASSRHPRGFVGHDQCGNDPWLHGYVPDRGEDSGANGKSFHPTTAGHVGYAEVLWDYIQNAIRDTEVSLNEAGLPLNPRSDD